MTTDRFAFLFAFPSNRMCIATNGDGDSKGFHSTVFENFAEIDDMIR